MQLVTLDESDDCRTWTIHNDQNGHEYIIVLDKDSFEIRSSSNMNSVKRGLQALNFLDDLMNSFAQSFARLEYMTTLKNAMRLAKEFLEK